jgi:hypothetical protein
LKAAFARRVGGSAGGIAGRVVGDPMHYQLKPWRLQQDVIVITICFAETEHLGIERGDLVKPARE